MLKRLPILCVALLALAACSHDSNNGSTPAAPSAAPVAAATTPASAAPAATAAAPAATTSSVPAPAASAATTAAGTAAAAPASTFVDNGKWVEGKNYFLLEPAQPKVTSTDKIEVVEVFSYGCPVCNAFHPMSDRLAQELPSNAVMTYLPASFIPQENWPMLQRAYYAGLALGVADKANDAMYDAVWKTGELSAEKAGSQGLKPASELPTLADAAKVYAKFGVDPKEFLAVAQSFSVNTKVKRADELVKAYGVDGTPSLVVDGKYRFDRASAGGDAAAVELAKWLVAKEAAGK